MLPLSSDFADFKVYDDKPSADNKVTKGGVYGSKTFKKAFIPLREGKLKIPSIKFAYFNVLKGGYEVLSTSEYPLDVKPSLEKENLNLVEMVGKTTTKEAVKIIGRDILPISTSLSAIQDKNIAVNLALSVALTVFPCLVYFALLFYVRRKEMHETDESILKRKRAYSRFVSENKKLSKLIKDGDKEYYGYLLSAFKRYIGDKFNVAGGAMTIDELCKILSDQKIDREQIVSITEAMDSLEKANFARTELSSEEKKELLKILTSAVKNIDRKS